MDLYGTEAPDLTDGDTTIRPANAEELGYAPVATAPARGAHAANESLFDELLGLAEEEVTNIQRFPVKYRKGGWVLEFDCIISEADIKRYRKGALNGRKKLEDADRSVGSAMILIEKNTGIYKQDDGDLKQVEVDGEPVLLGSTEFLSAFGKGSNAHVAIRKFLGDAETNTIGDAVLKAAGWSEDLEPLDPTEA
jgi:hypothetical protein